MDERRFPSIIKVVKKTLVLGHGNADDEREFSESCKSVTNGSSSKWSFSGIRATADGRNTFKGPDSVPITRQLLHLCCSAHYAVCLNQERKEKVGVHRVKQQ